MAYTDDISNSQDDLAKAFHGLIDAQYAFLQIAQQGNLACIAALQAVAQAASAPRRLITDDAGRPIGSQPDFTQQEA